MGASPIALGYGSIKRAELASRYVYVANLERFIDLRTGCIVSCKSIDDLYAHAVKGRASYELMRWSRTAKVDAIGYHPGKADFFVDTGASVELNTWLPGDLKAEAVQWTSIGKLIEQVIPDELEQRHFLDVLAFLVQRPGVKIRHMMVLTGPQGTGKSTLTDILKSLMGAANVKVVEGAALGGRFWDDFVNTQVTVFEEVQVSDRRNITDRLKTLVTERYTRVEGKGTPHTQARTPDLVMVLSNHETPLAIEGSDRRVWAPAYGPARREQDFYDRLRKDLPNELPGLFNYLLHRDLSSFSPDAPPPMTQAKEAMIRDSSSGAEQHLRLAIEERRGCFARDVVLPADVLVALRGAGFSSMNESWVRRLLRDLDCASCGQLPKSGRFGLWQGEPRVWSIRNHGRWLAATSAELRDEYVAQYAANDDEPSRQSVAGGAPSKVIG